MFDLFSGNAQGFGDTDECRFGVGIFFGDQLDFEEIPQSFYIVEVVGDAAGMVVLMETLRGTVRGVGALTAIVGQRPLVIVPYIAIAAEGVRRRKRWLAAATAGAVALVLTLAAIHFFYLPLDLLAFKIMLRLS